MNRGDWVCGLSIVSVVVCCFGMASPVWSAGAGSIRVAIVHGDGSPLEDALVTLHIERDGPVIRQARTCDDGLVLFEDLDTAEYVIRAAKPEYVTLVLPNVRVVAGRRPPVPLALRRTDSPRPCEPLVGVVP